MPAAKSSKPRRTPVPPRRPDRWTPALLCIALMALVSVAYAPVLGNSSINFDDGDYVFQNPVVLRGLTWDGATWALTTTRLSNWHPLTWWSHMLDCDLFRQPDGSQWIGGHHLVSVMGHALNAGLVLLLMWRMTGSAWRSALAAAFFAIHPQRVESVAWIAERKDILCVLFGLLTLHAYVSWAKRRGVARYIMMMAMYALSLAAKPMMVTLPFAMLLLDFWPLRRAEPADTSSASNTTAVRRTVARMVIEKIPLIALALASSAVTYIVQRQSGAMESLAHISWGHRLINAATSVVAYLRQMAWPTDLAVFYPHPQSTSIGIALLAIIAVVAVSIAAFAVRRPWPQVFVGWFWFVGTLVPVSGIVQVGDQARADRYTYLPSIGLALLIAWSVPRAWTHSQSQRWLTACGAGILLLAMTWLTAQQVRYWRNSETLFARAPSDEPGPAVIAQATKKPLQHKHEGTHGAARIAGAPDG
jgi:hypothetical protein